MNLNRKHIHCVDDPLAVGRSTDGPSIEEQERAKRWIELMLPERCPSLIVNEELKREN